LHLEDVFCHTSSEGVKPVKSVIWSRFYGIILLLLLLFKPSLLLALEDAAIRKQDLLEGERIFLSVCFLCHGKTGKGDGAAAMFIGPYMHPRPNNFTLGSIKFRATASGDLPTLPDLMRTIRNGIPGFMPSFRYLKKDGIRQVSLFVATEFIEKSTEEKLPVETDIVFTEAPYSARQERPGQDRKPAKPLLAGNKARPTLLPAPAPGRSFGKGGSGDLLSLLSFQLERGRSRSLLLSQTGPSSSERAEAAPRKIATLLDPSGLVQPIRAKREQLLRGEKLFRGYACIACHGIDGRGAKTNMKDERGLPVKAADLTRPETLGNGSRPEDIYRTIMTGLNGTPMPSFSGLFVGEEEKVWDLVHYIRSLGGLEP